MILRLSKILTATCMLFGASTALAETSRTMIVMDGSGSMWGQIDGRAKLEIARETVAEVLGQIPANQEIGLLAYGHRVKGDCTDIELMVPPAAGTGSYIASRVNTMRFLGKTPLSEAVRQAAIALNYSEESATVVLVTDGLETCEADPCALARELEATGLNFTAHVIGFGLTAEEGAQVSCLAENTGGRYIEARNASGLTAALGASIVAQAPEPEPVPEAAPAPLPTAGLIAPDEAPLGSMVLVEWSVSDSDRFDTITIGKPDENGYAYYVYATQNPVSIQMPGEVGTYELRYVSQDKNIVHRRLIEVTEAPLSLTAQDEVVAGQLFPVAWQGPDADYDNIQLRVAGDNSYVTYDYVSGKNPVVLRAPEGAGSYELTYKLNDSNVILTRPITVLPVGSIVPPLAASLTAPDMTEAGEEFYVGWSGPGSSGDFIYLRVPGDASYITYAAISDGNPVTLVAPAEPGTYELAYVFGDEQVLITRAITVDTPDAVMETLVPISITIEAEGAVDLFNVQWSAVPTVDNTDTTDVWALNEAMLGPVTANFFPGGYDVTGDAGDQVFFGRIDVVAGGDTRFVIPYSSALSPADEDVPANDAGPVPITIIGEYGPIITQWKATPASGQQSLVIGSDFQPGSWNTALDPGRWLITGQAEGGEGLLYAAVIDVVPATERDFKILRTASPFAMPVTLPTDQIVAAHCLGLVACGTTDEAGKLRYILLPDWAASPGLFYETAGGAAANLASVEFYTGVPFQVMASLNPRQWDASLGACTQTSVGDLCAMTDADPAAVALLQLSLTPSEPQIEVGTKARPLETSGTAMTVDTPIDLPDGIDPVELFAPAFLEEE